MGQSTSTTSSISNNLPESPPDTWDEVLEQGETLASDDKAGFAFTWSDKSCSRDSQFRYQAGGQLFNDSNEPTFVEEGVSRVGVLRPTPRAEHHPRRHVQSQYFVKAFD